MDEIFEKGAFLKRRLDVLTALSNLFLSCKHDTSQQFSYATTDFVVVFFQYKKSVIIE